MTTLECLYYPYSRTLNPNTIKKGVLLFNKVQFLDTQPWLIRKALLGTDRRGWHPKTLDRLWSEYDFLRQEGLIEIIDPSDFVKQNGTLITRSVASDISDDDFLRIAAHEKTKWQILRDRLPGDFIDVFNLDFGVEPRISRDTHRRWADLHRYDQGFIDNDAEMGLPVYELPYLQASSLRVNEALAISADRGLIPFTDSQNHEMMLKNKVVRAIKNNGTSMQPDMGVADLSFQILTELIPEQDLSKRSIKQIFRYRMNNFKKLERLRLTLIEFSETLNAAQNADEYQKSLAAIVHDKIIPSIEATRDEVRSAYEDAFGKIAIRVGSAVAPTLGVTTFAGMGLRQIMLASITAGAGVFGAKGVDDLLKGWETGRKAQRQTFSYFTGFLSSRWERLGLPPRRKP